MRSVVAPSARHLPVYPLLRFVPQEHVPSAPQVPRAVFADRSSLHETSFPGVHEAVAPPAPPPVPVPAPPPVPVPAAPPTAVPPPPSVQARVVQATPAARHVQVLQPSSLEKVSFKVRVAPPYVQLDVTASLCCAGILVSHPAAPQVTATRMTMRRKGFIFDLPWLVRSGAFCKTCAGRDRRPFGACTIAGATGSRQPCRVRAVLADATACANTGTIDDDATSGASRRRVPPPEVPCQGLPPGPWAPWRG